ncbi:MAG: nitric oxide synthase [Candidatus Scalindua sp.]|jgi:flavodoxin|nr:nitric oxide synthase [Candidatus Scalindua sp.]MBT6048709.1 nitric oxide synthase [Candidatus Scalindua sp.]MBT6225825.1 nitric oxide synthase [Candidatus Scalindua sp.]MBT6565046.1 nitric oxide synthase [Candidatus Scalindua sp.]MBT7211774.1 nitric oxide synthase [Candidatus Scalindua sp.]
MGKVLITYYSRTGKTERMAEYIAEGVRFSGNSADIRKLSDIKSEKELEGYDGYILGCPTYHRDMTANMKTFLFLVEKAKLNGKAGGAFGSYTHSGDAPKYIFDTMENVFKMDMTSLGSFNLLENLVEGTEGMRACQDYGKSISEKLGS